MLVGLVSGSCEKNFNVGIVAISFLILNKHGYVLHRLKVTFLTFRVVILFLANNFLLAVHFTLWK